MPRTARAAIGGLVYHVTNRGNGRLRIFRKTADYSALTQILLDGKSHADIDLFAYCLMPNHWHLVLRPKRDHDLARYLSWITNTHVKRYRAHYPQTSGHLYQGRYKSFPVQTDSHFLTLLRYVESNPIRCAKPLSPTAQSWPHSSLGGPPDLLAQLLSPPPLTRPRHWLSLVNSPLKESDLTQIRTSLTRDRPLGTTPWTFQTATHLHLQHTLHPRGRPRKSPAPALTS
ncbi:MAG TPA: transposase [Tepidisphaeraceae bacterium]|nr:transposase [Tepidisphaeraceae bacterium]